MERFFKARRNEKCNFEGRNIEVVNEYTHFVWIFTTEMSVTKGVYFLAAKGKRACAECARGAILVS